MKVNKIKSITNLMIRNHDMRQTILLIGNYSLNLRLLYRLKLDNMLIIKLKQ